MHLCPIRLPCRLTQPMNLPNNPCPIQLPFRFRTLLLYRLPIRLPYRLRTRLPPPCPIQLPFRFWIQLPFRFRIRLSPPFPIRLVRPFPHRPVRRAKTTTNSNSFSSTGKTPPKLNTRVAVITLRKNRRNVAGK